MSSLFMLDTDIASYAVKDSVPAIATKLEQLDTGDVCISAVTRAELKFGVERLRGATHLAGRVEKFLSGIHTLPWDETAADNFAVIRTELERRGTPIGITDTMIAAHAKALHAILVTNNLKHFRKVKGLTIENWGE